MLDEMLRGPSISSVGKARQSELQGDASAAARDLVMRMVEAGWRESEAALALADAVDDYCLYLASPAPMTPSPANSNLRRGGLPAVR